MTTPPPTALRCAHKVNPLGVAPEQVRFSWELQRTDGGHGQHAYQIRVERDDPGQAGGEAVAWDSGKVDSPVSVDIPTENLR